MLQTLAPERLQSKLLQLPTFLQIRKNNNMWHLQNNNMWHLQKQNMLHLQNKNMLHLQNNNMCYPPQYPPGPEPIGV